jgi:biopolymer transport protein ExbD
MRKPLVDPTPAAARINLTPIIDVALVLVIILLITAPMLTVRDLGVELPAATTRGPEDEVRVAVTMGPDGELAIDEDLVSMEMFAAVLQEKLKDREGILVVVRADQNSSYREVDELLRVVKKVGAERIAIATRQGRGDDL